LIYRLLGYRVLGLIGIDNVEAVGDIVMIPRKVVDDIRIFKPSERYLVAYRPSNKDHARRAGKVRKASTILFENGNVELCDEEQIEVMKGGSAAIELLLSPLLDSGTLPRYLFRMRRCIELAYREGVDIVISSGARSLEELWSSGSIVALGSMVGVKVIAYNWVEVLRRWRPGLHL
jgi:RNase P/RNase MRP subunit p30